MPDLRERSTSVLEWMDGPECDRSTLDRTYSQFRIVNRLVAGWRQTYRSHLRPALRRGELTTVLDIGSGGGDLARALAGWARRDGFRVHITAVDPDERAHAWATGRPPVPGVEYRQALSAELVAEGRGFDLVISNHLLHHLDASGLSALLSDSEQLARIRAVHSDIRRSPIAYLLFSAGTLPFFHRSFIRADGLISIRRSYTPGELRGSCPSGWRVLGQAPWRNLLLYEAGRR
nr:class I SAM-dependent methyltransferase [Brevibacterium daeguense]